MYEEKYRDSGFAHAPRVPLPSLSPLLPPELAHPPAHVARVFLAAGVAGRPQQARRVSSPSATMAGCQRRLRRPPPASRRLLLSALALAWWCVPACREAQALWSQQDRGHGERRGRAGGWRGQERSRVVLHPHVIRHNHTGVMMCPVRPPLGVPWAAAEEPHTPPCAGCTTLVVLHACPECCDRRGCSTAAGGDRGWPCPAAGRTA